MILKSLILICIIFSGAAPVLSQNIAELTSQGGTWTTSINGNNRYTGSSFADALTTAFQNLGSGTINVRNSGTLDKRVHIQSNQTLDFHNNEIVATNSIHATKQNGITIRNLRMTGSPYHSLAFHGCSDLHLHNIDLEFAGETNGIRVDNDRGNPVTTRNLRVTGTMRIQNTRSGSHGFETYSIDGIEIEQVEAHNTGGCGLLLNDSRNATIGKVVGTYNNRGGGYATFRVANDNGPNVVVDSVYSRYSGRGFFSVSRSGGTTVNKVDIANTSNQGIFLEDAHDTYVWSGTVASTGGRTVQFVRTRNCHVYVNGDTPPPTEFNAFSTIKAADFSSMYGVRTEESSLGGENVGYINNGDWLSFNRVDFGSGAQYFRATVASGRQGGDVEIRVGSVSGRLLGTCAVENTGGSQSWESVSCAVESVTGENDLFLVFKGEGDEYLFNIYDFVFGESSPPPPTPTKVFRGNGILFDSLYVHEIFNADAWSLMSGLSQGQTVFGDRTFTFEEIPQGLQASEWIQTAMDSRSNSALEQYATITTKDSGILYVAHSDRIDSKPAWLSSFTQTDMVITVRENETTFRTLTVYEKAFSNGEEIQLGINSNDGTTTSLMYIPIFREEAVTGISYSFSISEVALKVSPNPFNPVATISYSLPKAGFVDISIFNINGTLLESLTSQNISAGMHSVNFDGSKLPSGVYFVRMSANEKMLQKKMVLLK